MLADRIHEISSSMGVDIKTLANQIGIPPSTLQRYSNKKNTTDSKPSYEVLKALLNFDVSIDWLLTGEGEMYRANRSVSSRTTYRDNGIAVHTNNGNIGVGTQNNDSGGRGNRICQFAHWWMEKHNEDEQAWLEQQIARAVPEYADWRKEVGE